MYTDLDPKLRTPKNYVVIGSQRRHSPLADVVLSFIGYSHAACRAFSFFQIFKSPSGELDEDVQCFLAVSLKPHRVYRKNVVHRHSRWIQQKCRGHMGCACLCTVRVTPFTVRIALHALCLAASSKVDDNSVVKKCCRVETLHQAPTKFASQRSRVLSVTNQPLALAVSLQRFPLQLSYRYRLPDIST